MSKHKHGSIYDTHRGGNGGYRATVYDGETVLYTKHFQAESGNDNWKAKIDAAYHAAKAYLLAHDVS